MNIQRHLFNLLFTLYLPFICYGAIEVHVDSVSHVGIDRVTVRGDCLDLRFSGTRSDTLLMKGAHFSDKVVVKSKRSGSTLEVWVEFEHIPFAFGCSGELWFSLPSDAVLTAKTSSGQISAEKMKKTTLELKSASGSIDITDCKAELAAKTASGAITIKRCSGPKEIKSASGFIQIENSRGNIISATVSGAQDLETIEGDLEAKSVSGSLTMRNLIGALHCKTVSGAIHGDDVTVKGESEFESASGAINIELLNPHKDISFDLKSTSGSLSVGSIRGSKSLVSGNGKIKLRARTVSGSVVFD